MSANIHKTVGSILLLLVVAVLAVSVLVKSSNESGENSVKYTVEVVAENSSTEDKIKYSDLLMNYSVEVPILLYHHISHDVTSDTVVSPETFENHIKTLTENGYTGISFEQLSDYVKRGGELPPKPLIITFDDGYLSSYEFAYPILKKYNMKATIFVIGISVGRDTYRDTGNSEYGILPRFDYVQANEMIESGLISIQSHSYDMHQWEEYEKRLNGDYRDGILPLEGESEAEYKKNFMDDCILAKTELERETQTCLTVFSYPQGKYIPASDEVLHEIGIEATVTLDYGSNDVIQNMPDTLYNLSRLSINNISGEKLLDILRRNRVVIHDEPGAEDVLPRNLR